MSILSEVRNKIESAISVTDGKDCGFIVDLPLTYDDGDCVRLHVDLIDGHVFKIHDGGHSVFHAACLHNVNVMDRNHIARLNQIIGLYGMVNDEGVVSLVTSNLGWGVFEMAQASLDIVRLGGM